MNGFRVHLARIPRRPARSSARHCCHCRPSGRQVLVSVLASVPSVAGHSIDNGVLVVFAAVVVVATVLWYVWPQFTVRLRNFEGRGENVKDMQWNVDE